MAELDWRGEQVASNIEQAAVNAARAGAHLLRDEAVQRTPIETGTLRNSARASVEGNEAVVS